LPILPINHFRSEMGVGVLGCKKADIISKPPIAKAHRGIHRLAQQAKNGMPNRHMLVRGGL